MRSTIHQPEAARRPAIQNRASGPAPIEDMSGRGRRATDLRRLVDHGPKAVTQQQNLSRMFGPAAAPVQRMEQDAAPAAWAGDAVIDHTATLVIRGGGMPFSLNATTIGQRNPDVKKAKPADPWPTGLWTGISVVSSSAHVAGKTPAVVIKVPAGLEIRQCANDHHAEFRTTQPMSSSALNDAIKAVKTTGVGDGTVAQL